jgi:hypothetical protein
MLSLPQQCVSTPHDLVCLKEAASLVILDNIVKVGTQKSSSVNPGLSKQVSALSHIRSQANGKRKTHIKHIILNLPLAAQHKQRGEVVRLHNSEVTRVICDQVSNAIRVL